MEFAALMRNRVLFPAIAAILASSFYSAAVPQHPVPPDAAWPEAGQEQKPWTYWWWMGCAVERETLGEVLDAYAAAGFGGLHIVPIYGVQGEEADYVEFLSPEWVDLLEFVVMEARQRGLGIDMSTGAGWPFGGPGVGPETAALRLNVKEMVVSGGARESVRVGDSTVALRAVSEKGEMLDLLPLAEEGRVRWEAPAGQWTVYLVNYEPTGQQVKRAAPGGEGSVLDPFSAEAMGRYLQQFDEALAGTGDFRPRAQYHDSYEYYNADFTPDLLPEFEARRGYDLLPELPALMGQGDADRAARVRRDYRMTLAELHREFIARWVGWADAHGYLTRNQAHGAPANLLDVYATAAIPETEIFGPSGFPIPGLRTDPDFPRQDGPDPLMAKFASSAAHINGKPLVSSETCTWLGEHFKTSLAQAKPEIDQLFAAGINHIFYHGSPYSPPGAPWPGWLFYASTHFAPSNPFWRDFPALNAYVARVQSVLQAGMPDNDVLLYFPYEDILHADGNLLSQLTVHNLDWQQAGGLRAAAEWLWESGVGFDYVSDAQLLRCKGGLGGVHAPGGVYRTILVPACGYMPLDTMRRLLAMAEAGAQVWFIDSPRKRVPGLQDAQARQAEMDMLTADYAPHEGGGVMAHVRGLGCVLVGGLANSEFLETLAPSEFVAQGGVKFIRRRLVDGHYYFITHLGAEPVDGWIPMATHFRAAVILDPLHADRVGAAAVSLGEPVLPGLPPRTHCYLQLEPGQSLVLRTFSNREPDVPAWPYAHAGAPVGIEGPWRVTFLEGGPEIPEPVEVRKLVSWTEFGGEPYRNFSGTARYETTFQKPAVDAGDWRLDLGGVGESARVFLNGAEVAVAFSFPFHVPVGAHLADGVNTIAIEVTNLGANRIAWMDRQGMDWKRFHDINYVNIQYKPFDASGWPPMPSGLLSPVRLVPLHGFVPQPPENAEQPGIDSLGVAAPGWTGEIVAEIEQSYAGWDVEIGDADNDGRNEILVTGCPDSRLYLLRKDADGWNSRLLAENLARRSAPPHMGLSVRVVDLNGDGTNEIILGTGQEHGEAGPAFFHVMRTDGESITHAVSAQAFLEGSLYTHNFGIHDLDGDGVQEVVSAYCGSGEITRYDVSADLGSIERRMIFQNPGSGEDSLIADVDNDGRVEYVTCDSYRTDAARVLIFDFDDAGELVAPPRIVLDNALGRPAFNAGVEAGDVNNDGETELVVIWKEREDENHGTLVAYKVREAEAVPVHVFADRDPDLDLGYAEKMMCIADADNNGRNELLVTTRGERRWGGNGLGHVLLYRVEEDGAVRKELVFNFHVNRADAVWCAVGDADNDGRNDIVLATGAGHRERPGWSHVVLLKHE